MNPIPEKAEYLPARLGYIDTEFSNAYTSTDPFANTTTIVSEMIFSMTPKVIGPALIYVSILKFPAFIIARSAYVSCR